MLGLVLLYSQRVFGWRFFFFVALEEDGLVLLPWFFRSLPCPCDPGLGVLLFGPATSWISGYRGSGVGFAWFVPGLFLPIRW